MMTKETQLKTLYTLGALLLGGGLFTGLIPENMHAQADVCMTYLLMHSWLPSAKKPGQQG